MFDSILFILWNRLVFIIIPRASALQTFACIHVFTINIKELRVTLLMSSHIIVWKGCMSSEWLGCVHEQAAQCVLKHMNAIKHCMLEHVVP